MGYRHRLRNRLPTSGGLGHGRLSFRSCRRVKRRVLKWRSHERTPWVKCCWRTGQVVSKYFVKRVANFVDQGRLVLAVRSGERVQKLALGWLAYCTIRIPEHGQGLVLLALKCAVAALGRSFVLRKKIVIALLGIIKSQTGSSLLLVVLLRLSNDHGAAPSLKRHTLPQLPLPLPSLQLQPPHRVAQPLLLLPQLADLQLLQTTQPSSGRRRSPRTSRTLSRCRALPAALVWIRQSAFLQFRFGLKGLFAARHFVKVRFDAGEEGVEFGFERGEEGLLGGLEGGFGD